MSRAMHRATPARPNLTLTRSKLTEVARACGSSTHRWEVWGGRTTNRTQGGKAKLDVLGFDACLMGAAEVVSALGKYAHVFVGSQELVPGHGWDYTALAVLVEQPTSTPEQLARSLADGFLAQV